VTGETVKLLPSAGVVGDRFGCAVAIYDTRVIVGRYLDDNLESESGSAYVFDLNTATNT